MDMFMQILAMLFPAGLGSIITWMFSRNLYRAKKKKEVHDIYQVMYNDVCTTLTHIKDENRKLYQIVERFEKAVLKATDCCYWDDCPMRHELQESGPTGWQSFWIYFGKCSAIVFSFVLIIKVKKITDEFVG